MLIVGKPGTQEHNTKKPIVLLKGTAVVVDCYIIDPANDFHGATPYYHITSPPEDAGYYADANFFQNGRSSVGHDAQHPIDRSVPECPPA